MPIRVADEPLYSVVIGSGRALENIDAMRGLMSLGGDVTDARPLAARCTAPLAMRRLYSALVHPRPAPGDRPPAAHLGPAAHARPARQRHLRRRPHRVHQGPRAVRDRRRRRHPAGPQRLARDHQLRGDRGGERAAARSARRPARRPGRGPGGDRRTTSELLALNNLPSLGDYPSVTATVVGESPSNLDQVIEINKGSNDSIEVGMAVYAAGGLVGKITAPVLPDRATSCCSPTPAYAVRRQGRTRRPAGDDDARRPLRRRATADVGAARHRRGAADDDGEPAPGTSIPETTAPPSTEPPDDDDVVDDHDDDRRHQQPGDRAAARPGRRPAAAGRPARRHAGVRALRRGRHRADVRRHRRPGPARHPRRHVTNVINRSSARGPLLEVEPLADLDRLHFVRIVLYKPARRSSRATPKRRLMFASLVQGPLLRLFSVGLIAAGAAAHDLRRPPAGRRVVAGDAGPRRRRRAPPAARRRAPWPGSCSG